MPEHITIMDGPLESEDSFSLAVVRTRRRVLLGRKSRGFAEGQIVLPGGKDYYYLSDEGVSLIPGVYGASREVFEETGLNIQESAFRNIGVLHVTDEEDTKNISIYTANTREVKPKDSDELRDLDWYDTAILPYQDMPSDYRLWLPHVLNGFAVTAFLETDHGKVMGGDVFRQRLEPLGRSEHLPVSSDN